MVDGQQQLTDRVQNTLVAEIIKQDHVFPILPANNVRKECEHIYAAIKDL